MRKRSLFLIFALMPALAVGVVLVRAHFDRHFAGQIAAQWDLWHGDLRIKQYGGPPAPAWFSEYYRLLKDRYAIEFEGVGGCEFRDDVAKYADGYNEVMNREIYRRFGTDVYEKTRDEVKKWNR